MDPEKIPFNALVVGPTNCGKTRYVVEQLLGPYRGAFDYVVLVCPTHIHNKTYEDFAEGDNRFFVCVPPQEDDTVDRLLPWLSALFEKTNCLLILDIVSSTNYVLDDCAASKDVKKRSNQQINLAYSARHLGISVWLLTQQFTSIAKPFRENVTAIVLFYTPSWKDMKLTN